MTDKMYLSTRSSRRQMEGLLSICRKVLLVLILTFSMNIDAFASDSVITLKADGLPIRSVFEQIEKQSSYTFLYRTDFVDHVSAITFECKDKNLETVLSDICEKTSLDYQIVGETVIITKNQDEKKEKKLWKISGTVKDEGGVFLPGVTVRVVGTNIGTSTDLDGNFFINYPESETPIRLEFSYIGMQSQVVNYIPENAVKVILKTASSEIEEVVVTGIFRKSKESYTGAVRVVTEKELKTFGGRNLISSLGNIDPSFNVISNNTYGSDPNRLPEVEMRGSASAPNIDQLQDDTETDLNTPLIILDGFEISLRRMMDLDDSEVQSITLLKDASATAIYGSRGSNGVVVITTKEPEPGKLKLSYTGRVQVEMPDLTDYEVLKSAEKLELERKAGFFERHGGEDDLNLMRRYNAILKEVERGVETDWLAQPLRTGIGHRHNLKIEGGDKAFRYSASLQYNLTTGVMKGSDRESFNGTINLSYRHKNWMFRNNLQVDVTNADNGKYGSFSDYVKMNPYWTPYDEQGDYRYLLEEDYNYWGKDYPTNPLYNTQLNIVNTDETKGVNNNFSLEWRKGGLIARGQAGIRYSSVQKDHFLPAKHTKFVGYSNADLTRKGSYDFSLGESLNVNAGLTLSYAKQINELHNVYVGFNTDLNQSQNDNKSVKVEGFSNESLDHFSMANSYVKDGKPSGSEGITRRVGFVGNGNYSYRDRYYIDGSIRYDGSSQFGADNKFGRFWSAGLGWNLHKENFLENSSIVNRLKIRGSIGETGSTKFRPYEAIAGYAYYTDDRYHIWMGSSQKALENPTLKWQRTLKKNIGVEANLFNNRVSIMGDVYHETTKDLLSSIDLPLSSGFTSYKENVGEILNKGIELRATIFLIRNTGKKLSWSVTGSLSHNQDEVLSLSPAVIDASEKQKLNKNTNPQRILEVGKSQNGIYAVRSLGIDPSSGYEMFLDKNDNPTFEWNAEDKVFCGYDQPKFRGNASTAVRWGGFSMNAVFRYHWGGHVYNSTLVSRVEDADMKYNVDRRVYEERWIEPGDEVFYKGVHVRSKTYVSDRFVQKEAIFACSNINVMYQMDSKWLKRSLGMSRLTWSADMGDIFYLSTIKQERGTTYPFARRVSVGVSAIF